MFPAKPLRFRADLVCARSLRGRRRSSERRFFVPWRFCASSRLAGESQRANPGVRPPTRCPWHANPGVLPLAHDSPPACEPWHTAPGARTLACCPRHTAPMCELASRPVPMLQSLCPKGACRATCAMGSCWSTSANGAGWPRVPHPCEPACVRGRSSGKMLRRCAPERSAMAICCLGTFLSARPWQYIVLMHSRAFNYGSKLPWCIPERATDGKNAS